MFSKNSCYHCKQRCFVYVIWKKISNLTFLLFFWFWVCFFLRFIKQNPFTLFNLYGSKVRCAKLLMWRFVSRKAGISTFSFRTILNVASDSKLTTIAADFDNGRIGKLSTGSRVQSFPRAFSFGVIFTLVVFYINCLLSKGTIVNVKFKTIRSNKLDFRKLWTRTELMAS